MGNDAIDAAGADRQSAAQLVAGWQRGLPITPRDFDLVTDDAGPQQLAVLLRHHLIEPL